MFSAGKFSEENYRNAMNESVKELTEKLPELGNMNKGRLVFTLLFYLIRKDDRVRIVQIRKMSQI